MKKMLHVSDELSLPFDAVTGTLVVYGGKGMGKTNLGSVLMEELAANDLRFAVIVVADLVADEDVSVVIDISRRPDGTMWSIGERIRFVRDYCKRLYQRQGEQRRPIMQVIDEAARFIPQTIRKGDDDVAACMGAIAVLVEEGRNVAIGVALITQRSARLNKDVAELADVMIAFRTVGPNSRRAVLDWLGEHVEKERLQELDKQVRSLPIGTALVVSPGWLEFEGVVRFRARETFDSSATPKPGEAVKRVKGHGAMPDLDKYQQRMAETIERAKENDPKEWKKERAALKSRIDTLERQMTKATSTRTEAKIVEKPVLKDGQITKLTAAIERLGEIENEAFDITATIQAQRKEIVAAIRLVTQTPKAAEQTGNARSVSRTDRIQATTPTPERRAQAQRVEAGHRPPASPSGNGAAKLKRAERKICETLAAYPDGLEIGPLAMLSGYRTSGGFRNSLTALRNLGYIVGDNTGVMTLTDEGLTYVGGPRSMPTGYELARYWSDHPSLKKCERQIIEKLLKHPAGLSIDEIAMETGYEVSGGFRNALTTLRNAQVLFGKNAETMRLSEAFFQ